MLGGRAEKPPRSHRPAGRPESGRARGGRVWSPPGCLRPRLRKGGLGTPSQRPGEGRPAEGQEAGSGVPGAPDLAGPARGVRAAITVAAGGRLLQALRRLLPGARSRPPRPGGGASCPPAARLPQRPDPAGPGRVQPPGPGSLSLAPSLHLPPSPRGQSPRPPQPGEMGAQRRACKAPGTGWGALAAPGREAPGPGGAPSPDPEKAQVPPPDTASLRREHLGTCTQGWGWGADLSDRNV